MSERYAEAAAVNAARPRYRPERIEEFLRWLGEPATTAAIRVAIGAEPNDTAINLVMSRMHKAGRVVRVRAGLYALPKEG